VKTEKRKYMKNRKPMKPLFPYPHLIEALERKGDTLRVAMLKNWWSLKCAEVAIENAKLWPMTEKENTAVAGRKLALL
jgi:hypothetical protein